VFVNATADHRHDRAVRATAYFFQRSTGITLGIVMLDKLPPLTTVEGHADQIFHDLKLGRKSDGKALLFLWSEKEKVFKIEVSYDLEGVFTDAFCKRMEEGARTFMLSGSRFARRDFLTELAVTMKLRYVEHGRSPETPAAVVSRGTHPDGRSVSGALPEGSIQRYSIRWTPRGSFCKPLTQGFRSVDRV